MPDYEAVTPSVPDHELIGELLISSRFVEGGIEAWVIPKYIDSEIVLWKRVGFQNVGHGREYRDVWDKQVEHGYWRYANIDSVDELFTSDEYIERRLEPLLEIDGVGQSTLNNLIDNGFKTIESILLAPDEQLLTVPGLGRTSINRIRDEYDKYIERVVERR